MAINPVNNSQSTTDSMNLPSVDKFKDEFNNTIFAIYNDTDGIINESDVIYKPGSKESAEIKSFLDKFKNQKWTDVLKKQLMELIDRFNLEQEGDELFPEVDTLLSDNKNKTKSSAPQGMVTTGDYTPEYDNAIHSLEKGTSEIKKDNKTPYSNDYLDSTFEKYKNEIAKLRESGNLENDVTADLINDLLEDYKKTMTEWQDGKHSDIVRQNNMTYTNVVSITLKNGEHAYNSDQGVFYPYYDGSIGGDKVPKELYE